MVIYLLLLRGVEAKLWYCCYCGVALVLYCLLCDGFVGMSYCVIGIYNAMNDAVVIVMFVAA